MPPAPDSRARWERFRRRGPLHFIFWWGVVGWGLPTGTAFAVVFGLAMGPGVPWLFLVLLSLTLFPLGGVFFGAGLWASLVLLHRLLGPGGQGPAAPPASNPGQTAPSGGR
jgi:hypothetical protein